MATAGSICYLLWVLLYLRFHRKFQHITDVINPKEFLFPQIYFIGFGLIEIFRLDINNEKFKSFYRSLVELKGEDLAKFYQLVVLGAQFTYVITLILIGLFLGSITDEILFIFLGVITGFALAFYIQYDIKLKLNARRNNLKASFPEVLSKLTLLLNAGLVLREAWVKVAFSSDSLLYQEMRITSEEIRNGLSDQQAISNFAKRCALKEIKKFATIVTQNIQKGSTELTNSLKLLTIENWELKRHEIKRKSEIAGQKLLFPIGIMFIGILLMIMVPIFTNLF
jgi:tight adherence protein C